MLSKCAGGYCRVDTLVWDFWGNKLFTLLVPRHWGKEFSTGESGTAVPLLTSAASAPGCASRAGAAVLHTRACRA